MGHRAGAPYLSDRDCLKGRKVFPWGMRVGGQLHCRMSADEKYRVVHRRASGVRVSGEGLDDVPEVYRNPGEVLSGTKL